MQDDLIVVLERFLYEFYMNKGQNPEKNLSGPSTEYCS